MSAEVIAAWVAVAGGVPALTLDVLSRRQSRFDSQMSHAVDLLTGKTQRRSAGIAIVEGLTPRLARRRRRRSSRSSTPAHYWTSIRTRRVAWHLATCGLVSNQIVYLLSSSESRDRADELENLRRLVKLLDRLGPDDEELQRAVRIIDIRAADVNDQPSGGLWMKSDELLALKEELLRSQGN